MDAEESRDLYNKLHQNDGLIFDFGYVGSNNNATNSDQKYILSRDHYMYIYTALIASIFFICVTRSFAFYQMCLAASQRLHDLVFGALIRATMRFFDTNPSGRILNRFSKDLGAIDEILPKALLDSSNAILTIIGAIIVACTVNVYFFALAAVIGILFIFIRKVYLKSSKNIKRLEGTSEYYYIFFSFSYLNFFFRMFNDLHRSL